MNVKEIKTKCPRAWLKFIKWYAFYNCEQEGYIAEQLDNVFTISNMRDLYSFFDDVTSYIIKLDYFRDTAGVLWHWHGYVYAFQTHVHLGQQLNLISVNHLCKSRVEAEIWAFTQALVWLEKDLNGNNN